MGRPASHCGLSPKCRSHPVDWQKTRWSYQRKRHLFQACNFFQQTCQGLWKMDPLLGGCELSLHLANLKVEGKEPQMRSSLKEPHKKKHYQAQWTDLVSFAQQPQAWLCWWGTSCRACPHRAAAHLIVSPTAPAPKAPLPRCGILVAPCQFCLPKHSVFHSRHSAPAYLVHKYTSPLRSFSILCYWRYLPPPFQHSFAPIPVQFNSVLLNPFWGQFHLFSFLIFAKMKLPAKSNHASALEFRLKQARLELVPFVPRETFCFACVKLVPQLWVHHLFQRITW